MLDALRDLMGDKLKSVKLNTDEGSVASGGHHHLWRIYNGTDRTSGECVSVFIVDKAELEKKCGGNKKHAAEVTAWLKQGAMQLCKLQHPHVLRVVSPVIETNKQILLVTEQVFASLSNAFLKNFEGVSKVSAALRDFDLPVVEKQYGLYQLADAMQFMLTYAGIAHMNLTPESVYISRKGEWKVADFLFAVPVAALVAKTLAWNQNFRNTEDLTDTRVNALLGPNMNYAAPEYVLRNDPSPACDCFSFGCVTYDVLRRQGSAPFLSAMANISVYQQEVDKMHHRKDWAGIDLPAQQTIISLTHRDISQRVDFVKLVTTAPLFGDPLIRCLIYVSRMSAQDTKTKMPFLKTLYDSVTQYSPRIITMKIIPSLLPELEDERMYRFILPILFLCVTTIETSEVEKLIMPALGPILLRTDVPVVAQLVLERFSDLITKVHFSSIEKYILPFLVNTLGSIDDPRVVVPLVNHVIAFTTSQLIPTQEMKSRLLPLMITLLSQPPTPVETKLCILDAIQKLFPMLDADTVKIKVEPALHNVITAERDGKVLMLVVDVYSCMAERYGRDMTVHNIIPSLCPLLLSTTLVYDQIHAVAVLISKLVMQIDQERNALLQAELRAKNQVKSTTATKPEEVVTKFDDFNAHAWKAPTVEAQRLKTVEPVAPLYFTPPPPSVKAAWAPDFSMEPAVKPSAAAAAAVPPNKGGVSSKWGPLQQVVPPPPKVSNATFDDMDDFFGTK